jgi:hypothetical protein
MKWQTSNKTNPRKKNITQQYQKWEKGIINPEPVDIEWIIRKLYGNKFDRLDEMDKCLQK